jgi:lysine 6-dehydrogenase
MEYKTLRYPGHAELMRGIRALGLFDQKPIDVDGCLVSPRKFFIAASTPKLRNPVGRDVVVLRVVVTGEKAGRPTVVQYDLVDYHDRENLVTAMMRTTGYSLAITALMQAQGEVKTDGAETPDAMIPAEPYIAALAERGIHIRRTVS